MQDMKPKFALGDRVKCKMTGFKGTINAINLNLNGCVRYSIQPDVDKDGKMPDAYYFDEQVVTTWEGNRFKPEMSGRGGPIEKVKR